MPTFDRVTGRHERVPQDRELPERLQLLQRKGLIEDRPIPRFDALAQAAGQEAADLVGRPHGFRSMVNFMKRDYQYFAGMWVPPDTSGESQVTAADTPAPDRFMDRTSGWCVHTVDRRKALPLNSVFDSPRWLGKAVYQLGARSYLGTPLIHQPTGIVLGTFCFVGQETTDWGREGVALAKRYATQVMDHIEALPDTTPPPPLHGAPLSFVRPARPEGRGEMSSMYTYLTDDHLCLRDQARDFGHSVITPHVPRMEASGTHTDSVLPRMMGEMGWCGVITGAEYGGMGLDHVSKTILIDEVSYFSGAAGGILQASLIPTLAIEYLGSQEQKRLWLPQIAAGLWSTIAVTEPDSGSHVLGMDATARREGNQWIINARKCFIGNSGIAGLHVVVARTGDPGDPRSLSAFLVEADRPGIEITQPGFVGMHGFTCGDVNLCNVRVPATHLLGQEGDGLAAAYTASVVCGRPNLAATALGIHRRAMDETLAFLDGRRRKTGKHFQEARTLSENAVVKYRLGIMTDRLMTAERLAYDAVHLLDRGRACDAELVQSKLVNNVAAGEGLRDAGSLHGGYAARTDHLITRLIRDVQHVGAPAGPDDIQRHRLSEKALGAGRKQWSADYIHRTQPTQPSEKAHV